MRPVLSPDHQRFLYKASQSQAPQFRSDCGSGLARGPRSKPRILPDLLSGSNPSARDELGSKLILSASFRKAIRLLNS